eukprot:2313947-Pyramimonas_sp.AAC.1
MAPRSWWRDAAPWRAGPNWECTECGCGKNLGAWTWCKHCQAPRHEPGDAAPPAAQGRWADRAGMATGGN